MRYIYYANGYLYCSCRDDQPDGTSKADGILDEVIQNGKVVGFECPDCKAQWVIKPRRRK